MPFECWMCVWLTRWLGHGYNPLWRSSVLAGTWYSFCDCVMMDGTCVQGLKQELRIPQMAIAVERPRQSTTVTQSSGESLSPWVVVQVLGQVLALTFPPVRLSVSAKGFERFSIWNKLAHCPLALYPVSSVLGPGFLLLAPCSFQRVCVSFALFVLFIPDTLDY